MEMVGVLVKADENLMELDIEENTKKMNEIRDNLSCLEKKPKAEASKIVNAFAESKPILALASLVALQTKQMINFELENNKTFFCTSFMGSLVMAMNNCIPEGQLVANQYVTGGGVVLTCEVLAMRDHVAHKDDEVRKPNTAYNISRHLALLRKAYNFDSLQSGLGEILRENNYFSVLIPYATSKYVVLTMLIHYFTYLGIDFLTLH